MAGTCRGLVERDKKGIWFIVTVAADNMQGRGRVTSSLRGNDLGDGVGLIWESVPTRGKNPSHAPGFSMGEVGNSHRASLMHEYRSCSFLLLKVCAQ